MNCYIGLDLGGTHLKSALGAERGEIVFKNSIHSNAQKSQCKIFETIFNAIEQLLTVAKSE
ncbi:MAG: ROK family protein, partial [bacterium]|nr:ROK family protein [bacterium]